MAQIGIYNEPSAGGLGGSEYAIAVLAKELSKAHEVEIVHHRSTLTTADLEGFSGLDLNAVGLRYVEPEDYEPIFKRNLRRRYEHAKFWRASLSDPYDLFICSVHGVPPFCHARKGALIVLFPFCMPPGLAENLQPIAGQRLSSLYYRWEWKQRMATYQLKTANSEYTRAWTQRRWGMDTHVTHAPVDTSFRRTPKDNIILSIGRFSLPGEGHGKKHKEMLEAFQELRPPNWNYLSVGTLADTPEHRSWFDTLSSAALGQNAKFRANLSRAQLREALESSKIFWHAAGYGEDENRNPELTEHFGIVTVEAMAAGCVPVVIRKGGQPEIVEHGVSGFLWDTLGELKDYTNLLIRDQDLRQRMSDAARLRAQSYSREAFVGKFLNLLEPLLGNCSPRQ